MSKISNNQFNNNMIVEDKDDEEEKSIFRFIPYFFLFTVLLFFCVFGITYSVYKGTEEGDDNGIVTDQIIFTYSDVDKIGSGIYLKDATPISDSQGKMMIGNNQYFDFNITSTTGKTEVSYQLLLNKDDLSTLSDKNVRIYLTQLMGSYEEEILLINVSDLKMRMLNDKDYYVLYEKQLSSSLINYNDSYRLRMWVKEDAQSYEDQYFSVKVDVYAEQIVR